MPERYVLVYNAGGTEVLHVKPLRHAIRMLHRGVAVVREAVPGRWFGCYELPSAIDLVGAVRAARAGRAHARPGLRGGLG